MRISDWSSDVCSSDLDGKRHTRMLRQRHLDFGGIDHHATAQYQIGASIGNVEIPLLVQPPEIADGLVAVVRAMRLRAKVAIGRARAGERQKIDLADLPRPQLLAIFTKNANMAVDRSPDGPAMGQPLGATQDSVEIGRAHV